MIFEIFINNRKTNFLQKVPKVVKNVVIVYKTNPFERTKIDKRYGNLLRQYLREIVEKCEDEYILMNQTFHDVKALREKLKEEE